MQISALYRYPVKSMGGESVTATQVHANGFLGDRRYAIQDVESGSIACAKIPRKWGELLNFVAAYVSEPERGEPLPPLSITFPDGTVRRSDSPDIDADLSSALGRQVRLVVDTPAAAASEALWRVVEGHEATEWTRQRTIGVEGGQDLVRWELAEVVPKVQGEDTFFDLAPLHVLTTSTLRHLEQLTPGVDFDPMRFRPNILLETSGTGFVEQEWLGKSIWIGQVGMVVLVPTPRCGMPTLGQWHENLSSDRRVLRSIAAHNTLEVDALGAGRWACAGIYAGPTSEGRIAVGSGAEIEETSPEVLAQLSQAG